jgi:F0F1-type ATP synthase assembly protein I
MKYSNSSFKIVKQILKTQLALGAIAVIILAIFRPNLNSVISATLGVSFVVVTTFIYAKIAFAKGLVLLPSVAFLRHQKAMFARFLINILLFILVFLIYRNCDFLALFTAYIVTMSSYWFSLIAK